MNWNKLEEKQKIHALVIAIDEDWTWALVAERYHTTVADVMIFAKSAGMQLRHGPVNYPTLSP